MNAGYAQPFDGRVAIEAILYLAGKSARPASYRLAKLFYFADRLHLERCGRLICGDVYVAMKQGPAPLRVYTLLLAAQIGQAGADEQAAFSVAANCTVTPHRSADPDWLSVSERECLDEALRRHDLRTLAVLNNISRDAAWRAAGENGLIPLSALVDGARDAASLREHLADPHP